MRKWRWMLALSSAGYALFHGRRYLMARLLKLPPPRFQVTVERNIAVSMHDGIQLFTDHYYPSSGDDFPTILIRTPYGRGKEAGLLNGLPLAELPGQRFAEQGYHVVVQGARGCFDSGGKFSPHVNELADGHAAAEWISRQPWFNGQLATWGPSYLGYTQWAAAISSPEILKASLAMITSTEDFSVTHPDGAFGLESRLRWVQGIVNEARLHRQNRWVKLRHRLAGGSEARLQKAFYHLPLLEADVVAAGVPIVCYREILKWTDREDPFWTARDHSTSVSLVTAPVHLIGGWYDYYLRGLLRDYQSLVKADRAPFLTIGPWHHAHPQGLLTGLREAVSWFDTQLKGKPAADRKPVRLFVLGANAWRDMDSFPPPCRETTYTLQPQFGLSPEEPAAGSHTDQFQYDPADPTPAVGGALLAMKGAGPQDNRELEARDDVLVYSSEILSEPLTIIGRVKLRLFVRSDREHTDFFGRLCDVAPDGVSTNICDGLFRIEPGKGERQPDGSLMIQIDMWATACQFQPGHRLRLQVSSGAHPRWSRNLGTGEPIATGTAMQIARQTIYLDAAHPSALLLPVVA